ncbi:uncharacterized protein VTP21DRAFT_8474 [Calcarisporiella thermophila]|uniref:uncharacterized protein n=1 Tax=Calcarisporiella thermophila TaxID=911321 RepID=UPI0037420218
MALKSTFLSAAVSFFFLFGLAPSFVSAHGRMTFPAIRIKPGDSARNDFINTEGPTENFPCGGSPPGQVKTTFQAGQQVQVKWHISIAHDGPCFFELSPNGDNGRFQQLLKVNDCAKTVGDFSRTLQLPQGVTCNKCTMRYRWLAVLPAKPYLNCADVRIVGNRGAGGNRVQGNRGQGNRGQGNRVQGNRGQGNRGQFNRGQQRGGRRVAGGNRQRGGRVRRDEIDFEVPSNATLFY